MRPLLALSLVLAAGCTDASAVFELSWHVPGDATCESAGMRLVSVVVTDLESGHAETWSSPCLAGRLTTDPLPLGDYKLVFTVSGTSSDRMGARTRYATLAYDGQIHREPSVSFHP